MSIDLRTDQLRTNKIIASGSTGTNALLLIYPVSASSNLQGGINSSLFDLSSIGTDVFMFVSGASGSIGTNIKGTTVFGGDVVVSGTLKIGSASMKILGNQNKLEFTPNITIFTSASKLFFTDTDNVTPVNLTTLISSSTLQSSSIGYGGITNNLTGNLNLRYNDNVNRIVLSDANNSGTIYIGTSSSVNLSAKSGIGLSYGSVINSFSSNNTTFKNVIGWQSFNGDADTIVIGDASANQVLAFNGGSALLLSGSGNILSSSINIFSGSGIFVDGLSGSLQRLKDGTPAFIAGPNITIVTQSNGAIVISGAQAQTNTTRLTIGSYKLSLLTTADDCGAAYFVPAEHLTTNGQLRTIVSTTTSSNYIYVQLFNITSQSYVHIGGPGITTIVTNSTTPTLLTSSNLLTATNFSTVSSSIYELQIYGSGSGPTSILYGAELVFT